MSPIFLLLLTLIIHYYNSETINCGLTENCQCLQPAEPCTINCIGKDMCQGSKVQLTCTPNYPCNINCIGESSCGGASLLGGLATEMTVNCTGKDTCKSGNGEIFCGTGHCQLTCQDTQSGSTCQATKITVGSADSWECVSTTGNCDRQNIPAPQLPPTIQPTTTTLEPTTHPSDTPTTSSPSTTPSLTPVTTDISPTTTMNPSRSPSDNPTTNEPSQIPSVTPSNSPTTKAPNTMDPTIPPSNHPTTNNPSTTPSMSPITSVPTSIPTTKQPSSLQSTSAPSTFVPTTSQTQTDSPSNTNNPSVTPTDSPITLEPTTTAPSSPPTMPGQTKYPSTSPTNGPSSRPTETPSTAMPTTTNPSVHPSVSPNTQSPTTDTPTTTISPTSFGQTAQPSVTPTNNPSIPSVPSTSTTNEPTVNKQTTDTTSTITRTTNAPTVTPITHTPTAPTTAKPSRKPTESPTTSPTGAPVGPDQEKAQLKLESYSGQCNFTCYECLEQIDVIGDGNIWDLTFRTENATTNCTCPQQTATKRDNQSIEVGDFDSEQPLYKLRVEKYVIVADQNDVTVENSDSLDMEASAVQFGINVKVIYWGAQERDCTVSYFVNENQFFGIQAQNTLTIIFNICDLSDLEFEEDVLAAKIIAYEEGFAQLFNVTLDAINASIHRGFFCDSNEDGDRRRRLLQADSEGNDQQVTVIIVFAEADDAIAAESTACDEAQTHIPEAEGCESTVHNQVNNDINSDDATVTQATELKILGMEAMQFVVVICAVVVLLIIIAILCYKYFSRKKRENAEDLKNKLDLKNKYKKVLYINGKSNTRSTVVTEGNTPPQPDIVSPMSPHLKNESVFVNVHQHNMSIKVPTNPMFGITERFKCDCDCDNNGELVEMSEGNVQMNKSIQVKKDVTPAETPSAAMEIPHLPDWAKGLTPKRDSETMTNFSRDSGIQMVIAQHAEAAISQLQGHFNTKSNMIDIGIVIPTTDEQRVIDSGSPYNALIEDESPELSDQYYTNAFVDGDNNGDYTPTQTHININMNAGLNDADTIYESDGKQQQKHASHTHNVTVQDMEMYKSELDMIQDVIHSNQASEIKMDDLSMDKKIGNGHFGAVYMAQWEGNIVCVKQLNISNKQKIARFKEMKAEIVLASSLPTHHNLVQIYGYVRNPNFGVVMSYMSGDSVEKYVYRKYKGTDDPIPTILEILIILRKAVSGLKFLHKYGLVHRDIAARNILLGNIAIANGVDANTEVRISDFGLTRKLAINDNNAQRTVTNFGPLKWMAPESIKMKLYSKKSDVYMFAMTMWEVFYGMEPYFNESATTVAMNVVIRGERPELLDDNKLCKHTLMPEGYKQIMEECWKQSAEKRPGFEEVLNGLKALESNLNWTKRFWE